MVKKILPKIYKHANYSLCTWFQKISLLLKMVILQNPKQGAFKNDMTWIMNALFAYCIVKQSVKHRASK